MHAALLVWLAGLAPGQESAPASAPARHLGCPTRLVGLDEPGAIRLQFPGHPILFAPGLPAGLGESLESHAPPFSAVLSVHGKGCPAVLARRRPFWPGAPLPPEEPDSLLLDLDGDGRFSDAEIHPLAWSPARGEARAWSPELRLGPQAFAVQVFRRGPAMEGRLQARSWRLGSCLLAGGWHTFIHVDADLDGAVGRADLWLLAGPGDMRLKERMLDSSRLRPGTVPCPLPGGLEVRLTGFDADARALLVVGRASPDEEAFLAGRAAEVRERWAREFALDDPDRRIRLGLAAGETGARAHAPWRHTTEPRLLAGLARPGRPALIWVDEEQSTACRRLEHYTLGEPAVAERIARDFAPVHVPLGLCGLDPRPALGLVSVPGLAAVAPGGRVVWRHEGFIGPEALL